MNLPDWVKQIVVPLVISAIMCVANLVYTSGVSLQALENNIRVTAELSKAVTDLRVQMAIFGEKYVTREELDRKLDKRGPQ